jgi:O-succinylbenzoic acid--CoA ligase
MGRGLMGRPLHAHLAPGGSRFVDAIAAALDGGPAVLPVPPGPPASVAALLDELRPHAVVTAEGRTERLSDPADCPDEVAAVVVTSGSTGTPKGVELPAAALRRSAEASLDALGARPGGRWLACLPAYHIAGLQVLVRALVGGTTPVLGAQFEPAALAGADAAYVALVPTMLYRALRAGADLRHFAAVLVGGAATAPALLAEARAAGVRVTATYGMTETCGGCVYDGRPLPGVQVGIDADGRIRVAGPVLARGYRLRPSLTAAAFDDTGFRTDDVGRLTASGRLEVLGRADEVIVTGGRKVYPQQVEALLGAHRSVAAVVVGGVADEEWGQRVVAAVVPSDPRRPPELSALRRHVAAYAPGWTAPRGLLVVADLPRLASGKVDRGAAVANLRREEEQQT